jgi:hypothetical protein
MSTINRGPLGSAFLVGREPAPAASPEPQVNPSTPPRATFLSNELVRSIAEVKGQAQFLLYLADQIEDSLKQLASEPDSGHAAFLGKVLGMYSAQLESKHQGLGDRIAETCQEVYVTVREFDVI